MSNLGWPVKVVAKGGIPVKVVAKGGIPVTEAANGLGTPCVEADNGVAVTFVESGGDPPTTGVPFRITVDGVLCERVSIDGVWATIDGQPVYMEV